ncbi:MAG: serine hydrolase domain-containing protein [Vicinamibacterales bacterium]
MTVRRVLSALFAAALVPASVLAVLAGQARTADEFVLVRFEAYLSALREQAGIRGLSAILVQNGVVTWERGFGLRDIENALPATPDTPYFVGGLTQPLAATLALACAEGGRLALDAPMRAFSTAIPEPAATVRQVLLHASQAPSGQAFKYDELRYAALTQVIEACNGGRGYPELLHRDIFDRFAMPRTVPGFTTPNVILLPESPLVEGGFTPELLAQWRAVLAQMAKPYKVDKNGKATLTAFAPNPIDAATGVISTVRDLARFDIALDSGSLLLPATLTTAWSSGVSTNGLALPTGLGWFVQSYQGERVVWHFGFAADAYSSLIVKIPSRHVTLVLLANTDGLSAFPLASGDVTQSPFARLFLKLFI